LGLAGRPAQPSSAWSRTWSTRPAPEAIASARLKDDRVDARTLAHLLRADLLPEAWIAPPQVRDQRALLRHRTALVRTRTALKNHIHAVLADRGVRVQQRLWSQAGRAWLAQLDLPAPSAGSSTTALASSTSSPRSSLAWSATCSPTPAPTRASRP
jgi:hypothetical protein